MFLSSGFDGFVSKPIDIRELNAVLNKMIRDKQPPELLEKVRNKKIETKHAKPSVDTALFPVFVRDAKKSVELLQLIHERQGAYKTQEDIQMYIINVHAMKSALANIKEIRLSAFAAELEEAGRAQNISIITNKTPEFIKSLCALIEKLTPIEEENVIYENHADLREKLLIVQSACEKYDKKTAKDVLSELNTGKWSHETKEILDKIGEHILHSDFDEAATVIKNKYV
jgi:HPt (histidine-containing phosphotransfer) domain-containing protein